MLFLLPLYWIVVYTPVLAPFPSPVPNRFHLCPSSVLLLGGNLVFSGETISYSNKLHLLHTTSLYSFHPSSFFRQFLFSSSFLLALVKSDKFLFNTILLSVAIRLIACFPYIKYYGLCDYYILCN